MPNNLAKDGDTVTLSFVTSFPIIDEPTVTFKSGNQDVQNNNNITYNNPTDGRTWEASFDVVSTDNDGDISFTISGKDYSGTNRDFTVTTSYQGVTIDTTPPTVSPVSIISSNSTNTLATIGDTITLSFTVSEQLTGDPTVQILSGSNLTKDNSSTGLDYVYKYTVASNDAQGIATFSISVTDKAGNVTSEVNAVTDNSSVTVDTIAPVVTVTNNTDTFNKVELGGGAWNDPGATATDASWTGTQAATASGTVDTSTVGNYTITYSSTDDSGNTGTATRTVTVQDTTEPVVTVTSGTDTVELGGTWTDAGATATDLSWTGTQAATASGTVDTNTVGNYIITYSSTDDSGNTGTATRTVTVQDTTAPAAPSFTSSNLTNHSTPTIEGTAEADSTVTLTVDNTDYSTTASGGTWSITTNNLNPGSYDITATATDASNNVSNAATQTLTIDTTAPTLSFLGFGVPVGDTAYYKAPMLLGLTATFNEAVKLTNTNSPPTLTLSNGGVATYSTGNNTGTLTFEYNVINSSTETTDLQVSEYNANGGIEDLAGNAFSGTISGNDGGTVVIDNTAPTMTITVRDENWSLNSPQGNEISSGSTTNDTTIYLKFESSEATTNFEISDVTDTGGGTLNQLGSWGSVGTVFYASLVTTADGTYTIDIDADKFTDAAGNGNTAAQQFTWTRDTTGPTASLPGPLYVEEIGSKWYYVFIVLFSENVSDKFGGGNLDVDNFDISFQNFNTNNWIGGPFIERESDKKYLIKYEFTNPFINNSSGHTINVLPKDVVDSVGNDYGNVTLQRNFIYPAP